MAIRPAKSDQVHVFQRRELACALGHAPVRMVAPWRCEFCCRQHMYVERSPASRGQDAAPITQRGKNVMSLSQSRAIGWMMSKCVSQRTGCNLSKVSIRKEATGTHVHVNDAYGCSHRRRACHHITVIMATMDGMKQDSSRLNERHPCLFMIFFMPVIACTQPQNNVAD